MESSGDTGDGSGRCRDDNGQSAGDALTGTADAVEGSFFTRRGFSRAQPCRVHTYPFLTSLRRFIGHNTTTRTE